MAIQISPAQLAQLRARAPSRAGSNALMGAASPARSGYGGATFGGGGGGRNRYDHTQWGGGLYSIGIDPAQAGFQDQVKNWYDRQPANARAEVDSYWNRNQRTGNAGFDLANAVDWRQRDVARKIKIEHNPLGPLGTIAPIAASFIPGLGPLASAAIGAGIGGITGGWKGALLGGLTSAIGPSIKVGSIGNALAHPIQTATSVAQQFANPVTAARQIASSGVSRLGGRQ